MAALDVLPTLNNPVIAAAGNANAPAVDRSTLANNFTTFLTLLTTQLKNQNPMDPLDTNQFTQQLVQFAQVEQQMKQNEQLAALVAIEKTAQSTMALGFVGVRVAIDGQGASLAQGGQANWAFTSAKPASATISIKGPNGELAYSGNFSLNAGLQNFVWDGKGNDGKQWPPGNYTMSISAKDASGQFVNVTTEVEGIVDSVDLSKSPPLLSIGGQNYTVDKIKRVVRPNA